LIAAALRRAIAVVKPCPRLRLEPRPSRIACVALVGACAATAILIAVLRLPVVAALVCAALVIAVLVSGVTRCAGRRVPALVHVGIDRRIVVTDRTGRSRAGVVLDDSYVGAALTTVVWRADGDRWWRPARTMLFLPDSLPAEEFRRLRVVLRYGRAAGEAATSGVDAG
jgi:hypothetical protein